MGRPANDSGCIVAGCSGRHSSKGYCKIHAERVRRRGTPELLPARPTKLCACGCAAVSPRWRYISGHRPPANPLDHVLKDEAGCWVWTLRLNRDGYGVTKLGGRVISVHLKVWRTLRGPVPAGLELDHLCRNRACCNPDHLEPVTHAENVRRSARWPQREEAK